MALVEAVRAVVGRHHHRRYTPGRIRPGEDGVPIIFIETASESVYVPLRYFSDADKAVIYQSRLVVRDVVRNPLQVFDQAPPTASPRDLFLSSNSVVYPSCTLTPDGACGFLLTVPASSRTFPISEDRPFFRLTPGILDTVVDTVCSRTTGGEPSARVIEVFIDGDYRGIFTLAPEPEGEFVARLVDVSEAPSVECFDEGVRVLGSKHFLSPEKFAPALSGAWEDGARWDPTSVFQYALRCALTGGAHWCTTVEGADESFSSVRFRAGPSGALPISGPIAAVLRATGVSRRLNASVAAALHHLAELENRMRANPALIAALSRDRLLKCPRDAVSSHAESARDDVWLMHVRDRAVSDLCAGIASRLLLDSIIPGDAPE